MSPTETKEHAHVLIDLMAPTQLPVMVELLEKMVDPVALSLANAPFEDEEISEAEELAAAQARAETGPGTSMEDLLAEYGLTLEELERMDFPPLEEQGKSGGALEGRLQGPGEERSARDRSVDGVAYIA